MSSAHATLPPYEYAGLLIGLSVSNVGLVSTATILCVLLATAAFVLTFRLVPQQKSTHAPTVPGALPFLGNLFQLGSATKLAQRMGEWADTFGIHGVFEFSLLGQRYVVACSPATVKELMSYRPFTLRRPASFGEIIRPGLFSAEGDAWRLDRRIVAPGFSHVRVSSYASSVKTVVDRLADKWAAQSPDEAFAINKDLACFTADTVALVAFGADFDSLRQPSEVVEAMRRWFGVTQTRMLSYPLFRYWRWLPFGSSLDGGAQIERKLDACIDRIIDDFEAGRGGADTVLAKMIERAADDTSQLGGRFDRTRMRGNLLTLFIAGTDTTSTALTFMLHHLAKDAALQERAAKEAQAVAWDDAFDLDSLAERLPTLCATYYEMMRMHGPAPHLYLEAAPGTEIALAGRTYAAREKVTFIALCEYAGKKVGAAALGGIDPKTFAPERWLDADGRVQAPKSDVYQSFGGGHRVCPGRDLVKLEVLALCTRLLQKLQISLEANHPAVGSISSFAQEPDRDVRIVAHSRHA